MINRNVISIGFVGLVGWTGLAAADKVAPADKAAPAENKGIPEVAAMAKSMAGTWACDGNLLAPDGKKLAIHGQMTTVLALDGTWLHESLDAGVGEGKTAAHMAFDAFITYDAALKKFRRIEVSSLGMHSIGAADPLKDGKMQWLAQLTMPDGTSQAERTQLDASDPKKGLHVVGEVSIDKAKTWIKQVDVTCLKK